ncbi:MAG: dihydrolipoyl dehydrogenase [Planctomycetes bacterium]|nr:dihydrolipoyl dehydrogenase [Planctomycetota bacterium]
MNHDLIVIGGGPGGYVAAIRAAQLGLNVGCVEKEAALGGTCLRIGCIPSKALLESSHLYHMAQHEMAAHGVKIVNASLDLPTMLKRKDGIVDGLTKGIDFLFKKNKVTRYRGTGRLAGPGKVVVDGDQPQELTAKNIIIATGSKPMMIPGIEFDGKHVGTSTEALNYDKVPEHLVVIGGGVIGLELGSVWKRLGAKVTVLEFLDRIMAGMDTELARDSQKVFEKQGIEFRLKTKVTSAKFDGSKCIVTVEGGEPIHCDKVLVSVGRVPVTDGLGLETVGLQLDAKKRIPTDSHLRTPIAGIFAIGDCINGPMLAHKAEEEGVAAAEFIATGYGHVNYDAIPSVVYTEPEVASVGKTEDELKAAGVEYRKGTFQFAFHGRAKALGQTDGYVKVLADKKTDRVLGVHILGPRAGDLIAECAAAIEFGASSEDIARTCHAHPTLAEVVKEAALGVDGRSIHK